MNKEPLPFEVIVFLFLGSLRHPGVQAGEAGYQVLLRRLHRQAAQE